MLIPLTIFGISLAALIVMVVVKLFEERSGKRVFLPEILARRDEKVREAAYAASRSVARGARDTGTKVLRRGVAAGQSAWQRTQERRRNRYEQPLVKDKSARGFLKDVVSHRNTIRNGNGNSTSPTADSDK